MKYLPPFEVIRRSIDISTVRGELRVEMSYQDFIKVLKQLIGGIDVDETWYTQVYDDIAPAVRMGTILSARDHFINNGFFEGRMPFPMRVDEEWYLRQNPDVAEGIREGKLASAQEHFDMDGYREGRIPFEL